MSSKKRALKSEEERKRNQKNKSMVKNCVKKILSFISFGKYEEARVHFIKMQSMIDRLSKKRLFHKNKSARYKSNLYSKIQSIKNLKSIQLKKDK